MKTLQSILLGMLFFSVTASFAQTAPTKWAQLSSPKVPLSDNPSISREVDEVLVQAMGLTQTESVAFLALYTKYQSNLNKLRAMYPVMWRDATEVQLTITDENAAWMGIESLMRYEKKKARLQRRFAHYLLGTLSATKAAHFFVLENEMNVELHPENVTLTVKEVN